MDFGMQFRHSNGNLHIKATGVFDEESVKSLLDLFEREYPAGGRVFIDTEAISDVRSSGRAALGLWLGRTSVPASALFFMGEKGFQMAPDGTRVLIVDRSRNRDSRRQEDQQRGGGHEHRCCGRCAHCKCRQRHHGHGERNDGH